MYHSEELACFSTYSLQVNGYTQSVALTSPDGLNAAIGEGNPQRSDIATVVHVDIADLLKWNAKGLSHMFHHCLNNKRSRHRPYICKRINSITIFIAHVVIYRASLLAT